MIWKQMLGYVPVNVANIIVSFGTIAILTRLFDGAEFGRYALAVASMHFIHTSLFSWIEAAMARYYARAERLGTMASHIKTSYVVSAILGVVALPLILVGIYLLPLADNMKLILAVALSSTCLTLVYNIGIEAHRAAHRIGRYSAIHSGQSIIGFMVGILLIMMTPLREVAPFIGIFVATVAALAIDLPFMLKRAKGGKIEKPRTREYFNYGMPVCLALMLAYMLSQGDLFFIKYFMGDLAVGEYNAGYNLANRSLDVLFLWVGMAVTPIAITALEQDGLEKTKEVLKNYGSTLLLIILPAATGIALVAEPVGFVLGESVRAEAIKIIPWIAFAGVMNGFISFYAQRAFVLARKTGALAITMVFPVVLNFGLNMVLIPEFGLKGAVWATLASYGLGLVASIIVARRYFPLPLPWKALAQTSFACAVMAGVVFAINTPDTMPDVIELFIKAAIGASVYGLVAFATNAANCRNLIKDLLDKVRNRGTAPTLEPAE
jgi:O-antigen/teichoic acid export membrane protein